MIIDFTRIRNINLQLFAEGGGAAAGAGAEGSGTSSEGATGVTATAAVSQRKGAKNPLADVRYGVQPEAEAPAAEEQTVSEPDRNAEFERLIKGDYKDLYDAKMQETIQKRLKSSKETVEKFEALSPVLELLGQRYGVDATDIKALASAIEEDDSYYEDEALEKGISVDELKRVRKIERENESLRQQMRERETREKADALYTRWMNEAESMKTVYPSFNLETELQNPRFVDLLKSNIDVKTAFEVLHKDEIIPAAMQYTAKTVEQQVVNKIKANGARPVENGIRSQGAAIVKSDVSQLTKADRAEIARQAMQGRRITFGNTR